MAVPALSFEYPRQKVSWTKWDALLFANSIGCNSSSQLHFLYVSNILVFFPRENPEALD
jgi:hypothetical protein